MKLNYFKQLGILAVMVTLAGAILGCDENENRRGRLGYYSPTTPNYANTGVYDNQGNRPAGMTTLPSGLGNGNSNGNLGGTFGGILGGRGGLDPRDARNGQMNSGSIGNNFAKGDRATRIWPYVIDQQDVKWAAECSGKEDMDEDEDGICDDYEILNHASTASHPKTYNGFRVYGIYGRYENKDSAYGSRIETVKNNARSVQLTSDNVGVITGGWKKGNEPTNWNTTVKDEYLIGRTPLPFVQEVAAEGVDSSNSLLKKGNKFSVRYFAGFSSTGDRNGIVVNDNARDDLEVTVCAAGWFRKPVNSQGTAFRIMNAARWADDEVRISDNGKIVASSIRNNDEGSGFSKFFQERSRVFGGEENQLDYKITDSSYHYMEFCYTNVKQKDGQGEVRYIRDVGKSDYGYEPLSAVDFRVIAPEYVDKDNSVKRYKEIDTVRSVEGWTAPAKDEDVIAQAEAIKKERGEGGGKPVGNGGHPGTGTGTDLNSKIEEINTKIAEKESEMALIQAEKAGLENQRSTLIGGELERIAAEIAALKAKEAYYNSLLNNTPPSENPPEGGELQTSIPELSMYFVFFNDKDNSAPDYGLNDANFEYIVEQMANAIAAAGSKKARIEFRPLADGGSDAVNSQFQQNRVNVIKKSVADKLRADERFGDIQSLDEAVMSIKVNEEGFKGAKGLFVNHRVMLIYVDNRD